MADETPKQEEIKTATDARLDALVSRLDALEQENKALREANAGLYAMSNPAPAQQETQQVLPADVPIETKDIALETFENILYGEVKKQ